MLPEPAGFRFAGGVAAETCIGPDRVTGGGGRRDDVGGDGDATGAGETGILGTSKVRRRVLRGVIFRPRFSNYRITPGKMASAAAI